MADEDWDFIYGDEIRQYVEQNGVSGIEGFVKERLDKWKDIEVNIGITGDSGTGKSSFINAIRGLDDDDEKAAEVGVTETTLEPTSFAHPTNDKIRFWDLPGIGTPNYPDLETYTRKVNLQRYDTFLIFTAGRFTENDMKLARKIIEEKKKFFFIRTRIDENVRAEKRKKSFNEEKMLRKIRSDCSENLQSQGLLEDENTIFLISNHVPTKWDFARLTQAILDVLPARQRESLTLSLGVLTSRSTDILERKIDVLRNRVWMVASASAAAALVPLPGLSIGVDFALIVTEISFYRSQLGLPEEGTPEYLKLTADNQEIVNKFCFTTATQLAKVMAAYSTEAAVEEVTRFIPIIGSVIAGGMSFAATYYFLNSSLEELRKTALSVLKDATSLMDDLDID